MELDMMLTARPLRETQQLAQAAEDAGLGGVWLTESGRTAYLGCAAAALATERIGIGTGIAVAFPRSPMVTASIAWELQETTGGRFVLGLGSQVKAHVERRYSAEYSSPGPRMREYVESLRAIFRAFRGEEALSYEGQFYSFSLLPPQWSPGPLDVPDPPIYVSAVGPWMSRMVGELCDGVHLHPFHSPEYLATHQVPLIAEGAERARRSLADVTLIVPVMTAVGDTDEEIATTREHCRQMVAFYGSTRSYAKVFETHGFDGLSATLHGLQRSGDLAGMVAAVTDDVLSHYCVEATWDDLPGRLLERYRDLAPTVRLMSYTANTQVKDDPDVLARWGEVARQLA